MSKRFFLHGKKLADIHEIIDPLILPPDLGGTGESLDERAASWWRDIVYEKDVVT